MKKIMFLLMVSVLLLTGCGKSSNKNQVVCTGTTNEGGYNVDMKVIADFKDEKITNVSAEMKLDDEDTASQVCAMFSLINSMAEKEEDKIPYGINNLDLDLFNSLVSIYKYKELIKTITVSISAKKGLLTIKKKKENT